MADPKTPDVVSDFLPNFVPYEFFGNLEAVTKNVLPGRWKIQEVPGGGRTAFTVLGGNKETGEIFVLAVIEKANAPAHEHIAGGPYGELIITIEGVLHDFTDGGSPVQLGSGDFLIHAGGTKHEPRADFWFGFYHQPRGSRLLTDEEAVELRGQ